MLISDLIEICSMTSGQLEGCLHVGLMSPMVHTEADPSLSPGPSGRPGTAGERIDTGEPGITTGDSVHNPWNNNAKEGKPSATPKSPQEQSFLGMCNLIGEERYEVVCN